MSAKSKVPSAGRMYFPAIASTCTFTSRETAADLRAARRELLACLLALRRELRAEEAHEDDAPGRGKREDEHDEDHRDEHGLQTLERGSDGAGPARGRPQTASQCWSS